MTTTVEITLHDWRQIDDPATDGPDPKWTLSHSGALHPAVFEAVEDVIEGAVERAAKYPRDHDTTVAIVEYDSEDRSWTIDPMNIIDDEETNQ